MVYVAFVDFSNLHLTIPAVVYTLILLNCSPVIFLRNMRKTYYLYLFHLFVLSICFLFVLSICYYLFVFRYQKVSNENHVIHRLFFIILERNKAGP